MQTLLLLVLFDGNIYIYIYKDKLLYKLAIILLMIFLEQRMTWHKEYILKLYYDYYYETAMRWYKYVQ